MTCDEYAEKAGYTVIRFTHSSHGFRRQHSSQNTSGVPDRMYVRPPIAFWFEQKVGADKLSEQQYTFLVDQAACRNLVCCGGVEDLERFITLAARTPIETRHERLLMQGLAVVHAWGDKGFRRSA